MAAAQRSYYTLAAGSTAVTGITETVIATTLGISSAYPGCVFAIVFNGYFTMGSDQTGLVLRVRQGSLTGTAILTTDPLTRTTSSVGIISAMTTDTIAGEVAGLVYVLTATQSGGVANGTAKNTYSSVTVAE